MEVIMTHALTIEVSEATFRRLEERAAQQGKTAEALAAECVSQSIAGEEADPLLKWAGAIDSAVADVAERHDHYIGQNLHRELQGDRDD
jgi:hypothetical protein